MTCSFHKYGEYFPGTGELRDTGIGLGKNYSVNFPLRDGITDVSYKSIFEPVIKAIMDYFKPEAVVLQCGGDSLSGDRLGCFNLSMRGHANCVKYVKSFGLPTLILGGGGYTMRNVARTWAFETGVLVGEEMTADLPFNDYYEYYGPDYQLDVRPSNMENANSKEYLEKILVQVLENVRRTAHAPSVQMQDVPRDAMVSGLDEEADDIMDDLDEDENKDTRFTARRRDKYVEKDGELSESEDEDGDAAMGIRQQPGAFKRRNRADYRNLEEGADSGVNSGVSTPIVASDDEAITKNGNGNVEPAEAAEPSTTAVSPREEPASTAPSQPVSPPAEATEDVEMEDAAANTAAEAEPIAETTTEEAKKSPEPAATEAPSGVAEPVPTPAPEPETAAAAPAPATETAEAEVPAADGAEADAAPGAVKQETTALSATEAKTDAEIAVKAEDPKGEGIEEREKVNDEALKDAEEAAKEQES